ncbi:N-acetylmuramoyl-L-alanine amidase, partial [Streptomyces sp. NPDC048340]|uniref:N-acetylmuramoyl-L-alanine amidase n=1 Tax=Streptomyces sp. NPDC048340 TaxID=3365537 RepID=UPI003720B367
MAWAGPAVGNSDVSVQRVELTDKSGTESAELRRATRTSEALVTAEINVRAFRLVGLTWKQSDDRADGMKIEARFRQNGKWQDWVSVPSAEADPDGSGAKRDGTDPYFTSASDGIQLRINGKGKGKALPADLSLALLAANVTSADRQAVASRAQASMSKQGTSGVRLSPAETGVKLKARSDWNADESLADPGYKKTGTVKAAIVHHTVDNNTYTADDVPGMMRMIYTYMISQQGYGDFPYNFVVDKFGNTWEGRRGSIAASPDAQGDDPKAILGGHAAGFNTDTLGVATLGNFEPNVSGSGPNPQPTDEMIDGLAATLAWKFRQYGRDPLGQTQLTSAGGTGNPNPPGSILTVKTIIGHRDVNQTLCPGANLYSKMDALRTKVAALVPPPEPPVGVVSAASNEAGGSERVRWGDYDGDKR